MRHGYKKAIGKTVLLQYQGMIISDVAAAIADTPRGAKCTYKRVWFAINKHQLQRLFPTNGQSRRIRKEGYI